MPFRGFSLCVGCWRLALLCCWDYYYLPSTMNESKIIITITSFYIMNDDESNNFYSI